MVTTEFAGIRTTRHLSPDEHGQSEPPQDPAALPMHVLFTDRFMSIYTKFSSFAEMIRASGFDLLSRDDFENLPPRQWDGFVGLTTDFGDWEEMWGTAVDEYEAHELTH